MGMKFFWGTRTYTWKKIEASTEFEVGESSKIEAIRKTMGLQEKLKSITSSVTTGKIFKDLMTTPPPKNKAKTEAVIILETGERKLAKRIDY
jgi:hypothetical protein